MKHYIFLFCLFLRAHCLLANLETARALRYSGKKEQAIAEYQQLLKNDPHNMYALFELGTMHTENNEFKNACLYYERLIAIHPKCHEAYRNFGHTLRYMGNMAKAAQIYKHGLELLPDSAHMHYGLAESLLATGNLLDGFREFEYRWKREADTRNFAHKLWDGSNPACKKILIRAEYGQGDTLQCIRFAQLLKEQGAIVLVEAQHTLVQLLRLCPYIDVVFPVLERFEQLPYFDYQAPIMSLPYYFKTTLQTIPSNIPYLYAHKDLITFWEKKIADNPNFKIGICWEGSPYYEQFKSPLSRKVIALEIFAPLLQLPGVSIYSLQKMNGLEQLKQFPQIKTYKDFDYTHGRFMDTAALITQLDLVVTVDTSVAHLAGALGTQTFILLPYVADWRWLQNKTDCPWYPTMQLFRQPEAGNWEQVIKSVVQKVKTLAA